MMTIYEMVGIDPKAPKAIEFLKLEKAAMLEAWNNASHDDDFEEWYKITFNAEE